MHCIQPTLIQTGIGGVGTIGLRDLAEGDNIVEFTAAEPGMIEYTCWMGMLHGTITVTE